MLLLVLAILRSFAEVICLLVFKLLIRDLKLSNSVSHRLVVIIIRLAILFEVTHTAIQLAFRSTHLIAGGGAHIFALVYDQVLIPHFF
jgi:hypothetical protein